MHGETSFTKPVRQLSLRLFANLDRALRAEAVFVLKARGNLRRSWLACVNGRVEESVRKRARDPSGLPQSQTFVGSSRNSSHWIEKRASSVLLVRGRWKPRGTTETVPERSETQVLQEFVWQWMNFRHGRARSLSPSNRARRTASTPPFHDEVSDGCTAKCMAL
jgi:hypothetical protein